jgi:hypothetical protein
MKRRQFIKASLVSVGAIASISAGAYAVIEERDRDSLTIDFALKTLNGLSHKNIRSIGEWKLSQIFTHCAQSVEYSMSQFPVHKSPLFKGTIGQLAFTLFLSKGQMTHALNEPIPGASPLTGSVDPSVALNRLKKSLIEFDNFQGALAPHFAYGELTKNEYEIAHVMHLINHFKEVEIIN